ncbi:polysaccharide deacetylase family protein [Candidatus Saccharibacteria bacterium]|nr:polysaccharide deacetylase family protein [Candidatus Saccharibacteria bacterium]
MRKEDKVLGKVLLSFDIEEFDFPREKGEDFSLEEGVKVSGEGLLKILDILKKTGVKGTFFVTGNFAKERPELVKRIVREGHEVGAHGVDHFEPKETDVKEAKEILEKVLKGEKGFKGVKGWRQPRMMKINYKELVRQGYFYDSSVNPAFIPGRYNNFKVKREVYWALEKEGKQGGILEIPASVATGARIPMFWLALHLFPFKMYSALAKNVLKKEKYFTTYFHPWEFTDLSRFPVVPGYIRHNSGEKLEKRLFELIRELETAGAEFGTYTELWEEFVGFGKNLRNKSSLD